MTSILDTPYTPPQFGFLLREVRDAFDLAQFSDLHPSEKKNGASVRWLSSKDAQRLLSGDRQRKDKASADKVAIILEQFVKALIRSDVVPSFQGHDSNPEAIAQYVQGLQVRMDEWNSLAAHISGHAVPIDSSLRPGIVLLRVYLPILACSAAALRAHEQIGPIRDDVPNWAKKEGAPALLRLLLKEAGLTNAEFVQHLQTHTKDHEIDFRNVVDAWLYQGKWPETYIKQIADVLAPQFQSESWPIIIDLRRHYGLHRICTRLAAAFDWNIVEHLARKLCYYINSILEWLPTPDRSAGQLYDTTLRSAASPFAKLVLLRVLDSDLPRIWKMDIGAVVQDRVEERIDSCFKILGGARSAAQEFKPPAVDSESWTQQTLDIAQSQFGHGMPMDMAAVKSNVITGMDALQDLPENERRALKYRLEFKAAKESGDYIQACVHAQEAARLDPTVPEFQFEFAHTLGECGRFDEAIDAAWIAFRLKPDWDIPYVEIGVFLAKANELSKAIEHLSVVPETLGELSGRQAYNLGICYQTQGDLERALEYLELASKGEDFVDLAHANAAICALGLGRRSDGLRHSKRAKELGISEPYEKWQLEIQREKAEKKVAKKKKIDRRKSRSRKKKRRK